MVSHLQAASVGPDVPVGEHVHKLDQARHDGVQAVSCDKKTLSVFCAEYGNNMNKLLDGMDYKT